MDNQTAQPKMTKADAGYKIATCHEHCCEVCSFLLHVPPRGSGKHQCGIVQGKIKTGWVCDYFDTDLIKAANC